VGAPGFDLTGGESNEGQVSIYERFEFSGRWELIYQHSGTGIGGLLGSSLSLDASGSHLAVGAPYYNKTSGCVHLFSRNYNGTWVKSDQTLTGNNFGDMFGSSVSLSFKGMQLIIGAPNDDYVSIYQYNSSINKWIEHDRLSLFAGSDTKGDDYGRSVSQSSNGSLIAVGAPGFQSSSGLVQLYKESNVTKEWEIFGKNIIGIEKHDNLGTALSLSDDGMVLVIGAPGRGSQQFLTGETRVFEIKDSIEAGWVMSKEMYGDVGENFGSSVSINGDGSIVSVGASSNGLTRSFK
jgi:hypothetical protein